MIPAPALAALTVLVLTVIWTAGTAGAAYLPFWILAAVPGIPPGRRLFGRGAPAWIVGAAVGYTVSCLVTWGLIELRLATAPVFVLAWLLEVAALWALARSVKTPLPFRAWGARDTAALSLTLLLVPALMGAPYRNLGREDAEGRRYYRAYFTADFVWHAALASELGRFEMPPRNPYMAHRRLHYYWTYFLVPAAAAEAGPEAISDIEPVLKANAIATAMLLVSSIFLLAWSGGVAPVAAALAVLLVAVASSLEGTVAIRDLVARGQPLTALRDMNVDAITAWKFNGLRIDGVHRTLLYTPQHGLSCALGLLGLAVAGVAGARSTLPGIAAASLLLGLSTLLNPFLGAALSLVYGLAVTADVLVTRASMSVLVRHALAGVGPALAVLWDAGNSMGEGAGQALTIGWVGFARNRPILTLLLGLGPVLVPALPGLLPDRRLPSQPARVALSALVVGLVLFYFVMLSEQSWVGFRAGQILLATLPIPLARLLDRALAAGRRRLAAGLIAIVLLAGLPTTIVDTYNASDITNLKMGPGFPWTLTVSRAQREALSWIQRETPPRAIVQMEPVLRGRGHWSFIPTFARRRMSAGLPISLLPVPEYQERSRLVQQVYTSASPADAYARARRLNIRYLWVDEDDRRAYAAGITQFEDATYFEPVFRNDEVTVYRLR